jgi:FkbM family methyltransferase
MYRSLKKYVIELNNPFIFAFVLNTWNWLHGNKIRCKFYSKHRIFKVYDGQKTRYASVNSRVLAYQMGFEYRSKYLRAVYFLDLINFSNGDLIIDCGANVGDFEMCFKDIKLKYIAYEPNPLDFICLRHNVGELRSRNVGLWNESMILKFYVNEEFASSSFIMPPKFTKVIDIMAVTLSSEFPNSRIKLLKLEAEGAEPEVLQGACEILNNIEYIAADVGPERGIYELSTRNEVVQYLMNSGFRIEKENTKHRHTILLKNISYN